MTLITPENCRLCGLHNPTGTVPGFTLPIFTSRNPNVLLVQVLGDDGTVLGFMEFPDDLQYDTVLEPLQTRDGKPAIYAFAPPPGAPSLVGTKVDLGPQIESYIDDEALDDLPILRLDLIRFCERFDLLPSATRRAEEYLRTISSYSAEHWRDHEILSPISRRSLHRWYSSIKPIDPEDLLWWESIVLSLRLGRPKLLVPEQLGNVFKNTDDWRSALRDDLEPYLAAFEATVRDLEIESIPSPSTVATFETKTVAPEVIEADRATVSAREATKFVAENAGLRVVIYPGGNKILIAMSLADQAINEQDKNLAGFAIWRTVSGRTVTLGNRISFNAGVSQATDAAAHKWTPSDQAPFQKFRWVDVPPTGFDSPINYKVQALYFKGQSQVLQQGPDLEITIAPANVLYMRFRPAFTRGYIASKAYADEFHNAPIRPAGDKTPTFDTAPYERQYEWLGADARTELFQFIQDCKNDASAWVDVFAYDLDEPDVIEAICDLGKSRPGKVRAILDNAALHVRDKATGKSPPEVEAAALIKQALGAANVEQGHFKRFQHNKAFIRRDAQGNGVSVLFGSMNFSVRGIYVQANNVIVVDDAFTAQKFADAFDIAFANNVTAPDFQKNPISQSYMDVPRANPAELPKFSVSLSPHMDSNISLGPMTQRMRSATSSVLFAVMEPTGSGPVLDTLRQIAAKPTVFSYGTVETDKGLAVQSPNGQIGDVISFKALQATVSAAFAAEFDGGPGMHIHNKFVVVDFNASNPTVFTGSSNLAAGGEEANGDSLVMIQDAAVANMYAIEAVALFDHYHFRKKMRESPTTKPFTLWYPGKAGEATPWWKSAYDPKQVQMRDRHLFADLPLPAGLAATKTVDWSAVDTAGAAPAKTGGGAAKAAKKPNKGKAAAKSKKNAATKPSKPKKAASKASTKKKKTKKKAVKKSTKKKTKKTVKKTVKKTTKKTAAKRRKKR